MPWFGVPTLDGGGGIYPLPVQGRYLPPPKTDQNSEYLLCAGDMSLVSMQGDFLVYQ